MKKRVVSFILALCMMFALAVTASATSYDYWLSIENPYSGSLDSSYLQNNDVSGSAWVKPGSACTPTNYVVSPKRYSSIAATSIATNVSDTVKHTMTYSSGYGGTGVSYCLSGYPSNQSFSNYTISGTWEP